MKSESNIEYLCSKSDKPEQILPTHTFFPAFVYFLDDTVTMSAPLCGKQVKVIGTTRDELNGQLGWAVTFDSDRGRYNVRLSNGTILALKPSNLERAGPANDDDDQPGGPPRRGGFGAGFSGMPGGLGSMFGNLANGPQFREAKQQAEAILARLEKVLPPWLSPRHASFGLLAGVAGMMHVFGFLRTLLLAALAITCLQIAGNSYQRAGGGKKGLQAAAKAVGERASAKIMEVTGKVVAPSKALGLSVFAACALLYVVGGDIFSSRTARVAVGGAASGGPGDGAGSMDYIAQDFYAAGWQDATNNRNYGATMPSLPIPRAGATSGPARSSGGGGGMGIGTMVTLFFLGKTIYDLGGQPWNASVAFANLKQMDHFRMAMIAFLVLRTLGLSPI
eukprot:g37422.t1